MSGAIGISLGGTAIVTCVHDREKRQLRDPDDVIRLGREFGIEYDPARHTIQMCPCCENAFVAPDDTPRLCGPCLGIPVHELVGALPNPRGVIS